MAAGSCRRPLHVGRLPARPCGFEHRAALGRRPGPGDRGRRRGGLGCVEAARTPGDRIQAVGRRGHPGWGRIAGLLMRVRAVPRDPVWGRGCRGKVISSPGRRAMFAAVVDSSRKDPSVRVIYFREEELQMPTGTIKKLVSDRGFGFIAAEDGKEYFFHRTGLDSSVNFDSLAGGERVSFEIEASQKGPRANRIKLA